MTYIQDSVSMIIISDINALLFQNYMLCISKYDIKPKLSSQNSSKECSYYQCTPNIRHKTEYNQPQK